MQAHVQTFVRLGYPVTVVAGRGEGTALPAAADYISIPEIDSLHPRMVGLSSELEDGEVPPDFDDVVDQLVAALSPALSRFDNVIVHNLFTKHFNLPATAALHRLLDASELGHCIAWCHDFTWTSPSSRSKVHPGYPWELLRSFRPDVTYVVVSERRKRELVSLLGCPSDKIHVVYNGVEPCSLLGLSAEGWALVSRLGLLEADIILLMPVRVTQAKNIEYALHLVAAIKARGQRPKLIVTGPPDPHDPESIAYFQELKTLRHRLNVDEEVSYVFEAGPDPGQPYTIDERVVGDLFRVSDVTFMPSHREGFGMPVLEAGLVGVPVFCTDIPVAEEIGGHDVTTFTATQAPDRTAEAIVGWAEESPIHRLRRRVRQSFTWDAIFRRDIAPLLDNAEAG